MQHFPHSQSNTTRFDSFATCVKIKLHASLEWLYRIFRGFYMCTTRMCGPVSFIVISACVPTCRASCNFAPERQPLSVLFFFFFLPFSLSLSFFSFFTSHYLRTFPETHLLFIIYRFQRVIHLICNNQRNGKK